MVAASCFTLAVIHLLVWVRNRSDLTHFSFVVLALSLGAFSIFELTLMGASSIDVYLRIHRLAHIPMCLIVVSIVLFVRLYFGTGRLWLLWTVVILRGVILILTYYPGPTFNFSEVTALTSYDLLGESVTVAQGTTRAWARIGEFSAMLALVFVVDASITLWKKGSSRQRQRAVVVGVAVILCIIMALTFSLLYHTGRIQVPYLVSLTFMLILGAMAYELSRDMIGATRLAADLQEVSEDMQLAAEGANLAIWRWDVEGDNIWVNSIGRRLYGISEDESVGFERFVATIHPEDQAMVRSAVEDSLEGRKSYSASYRVVHPDGSVRWIEAQGRVASNDKNSLQMRGVSIDATERWQAERESRELRKEIAHTGRVTLLGQLSSALAHELSQPVGSIRRNAEAAVIMLRTSSSEAREFESIIQDIHADVSRAGAVIERLHDLLRRQDLEFRPVSISNVIRETLSLLVADADSRGVNLKVDDAEELPAISGDRVHLIQVFLNLIMNAMDAVDEVGGEKEVSIAIVRLDSERLQVCVRDSGPGIPEKDPENVFDPFFTTKQDGMGMGLPVCKAIIEAHSGTLDARNIESGGAEFRVRLPSNTCAEY